MLWGIIRFFAELTFLQFLTSTFILLDAMLIHIRVRRLRHERKESERRQAKLRAQAAAERDAFERRQEQFADSATA